MSVLLSFQLRKEMVESVNVGGTNNVINGENLTTTIIICLFNPI